MGHCHEDGCCCHSHGHTHFEIPLIPRIILGVLLMVSGFIFPVFEFYLFLLAYLVLGYDILLAAVKNLLKLRALDENFLMSIAGVGAFISGEHFEAAAIMLFYQIGEAMSENASVKTKASLTALLDVRPDTARIATDEGEKVLDCRDIKIGDIIILSAGERIAVDGKILKGSAMLDTSSLTGESIPREATVGDSVLAGMISTDGSLEIVAEKKFSDSILSEVLEFAKSEHCKKSNAERFITSFAKIYTPTVVALAVLVAVIPPIFSSGEQTVWILRALSFLVISCPCALVVSVPLTFFASLGCFSKNGILVKNSVTIERLSKIKTVLFDKTGTLTKGKPTVLEISPSESILELASYAECDSTHPLAAAVKSLYKKPVDRSRISAISEIPARGVCAVIDGDTVFLGNKRLLLENSIEIPEKIPECAVLLAKNGSYSGYIRFGDDVKPDAKYTLSALSEMGIDTAVLSGDSKGAVKALADELGIKNYFAELMPSDKAEYVKKFSKNGGALFVGDGINDAPSIAVSSVGVAMGAIGSDIAIESADMVIMGDEPSRLIGALNISRKTMSIAKENILLAIGIKLLVMTLSIFGIGGMLPAIFADVGVCIITVLNAIRAYYIKFC